MSTSTTPTVTAGNTSKDLCYPIRHRILVDFGAIRGTSSLACGMAYVLSKK